MKKTISILLSIFLAFLFVCPVAAEEDTTVVTPRNITKPYSQTATQTHSFNRSAGGNYTVQFRLEGDYTVCGTAAAGYYVCDYNLNASSGVDDNGANTYFTARATNTTYTVRNNGPYLDVTVTSYVTESYRAEAYYSTTYSHTFRLG